MNNETNECHYYGVLSPTGVLTMNFSKLENALMDKLMELNDGNSLDNKHVVCEISYPPYNTSISDDPAFRKKAISETTHVKWLVLDDEDLTMLVIKHNITIRTYSKEPWAES